MTIEIAGITSPIGNITLAVRDRRLCGLTFADHWAAQQRRLAKRFGSVLQRDANDPVDVVSRLRDYFAGNVDALAGIEVDPGGTPFQQRVWKALQALPPGRTVSYAELAQRIGAPAAVRAVGAANGANPIWIVIPCHRVINADGRLGGYGGGLERKRWLLRHEGAASAPRPGSAATSDLFDEPVATAARR
jgi:methylated-DNA-[protein]-cysteine S-methyltransferase